MGPRSDNRGYVPDLPSRYPPQLRLQWVHGLITVVTDKATESRTLRTSASMGPRSDNRGYGNFATTLKAAKGPASMGPRSDNRGYA